MPNIRWNDYRSTSVIDSNKEDTGIDENIQKSRQEGSLSYLLSPFEFVGTLNRFSSIDDYTAARNRRRNRSSGSINLVEFKWASINTSYELEQTQAKEPLLTLDGENLGISDWIRATNSTYLESRSLFTTSTVGESENKPCPPYGESTFQSRYRYHYPIGRYNT